MGFEDFSAWQRWEDRSQIAGMKFPGVYVLCISNTDIATQPFQLLPNIIYIGMTNSKAGLKGRLTQFDNTIKGKQGHGGADRVRYKHRDYDKLIAELYISVRKFPCDVKRESPEDLLTMGDVSKHEYECFAEYKKRYHKWPEFNDKKLSDKYSRRGRNK